MTNESPFYVIVHSQEERVEGHIRVRQRTKKEPRGLYTLDFCLQERHTLLKKGPRNARRSRLREISKKARKSDQRGGALSEQREQEVREQEGEQEIQQRAKKQDARSKKPRSRDARK